MKPTIEVSEVSKRFGDVSVLKHINLNMSGGKIYGFVGRNGSGKTVLMKCICGFLRVSSGKILVNGEDITGARKMARGIGALIESPGFLNLYTGYQNLKFLADITGSIGRKEVRQAIERVELDPNMKKPVGQYSLGMRQRLGIAQAIMEDPPILLLDEPMNSLDESAVGIVRRLLLEEKERGKLIVIATHVKEDVELLCDEVYQMRYGEAVRVDGGADVPAAGAD